MEYYYPGAAITPDLMKVEMGIPALTNPILAIETSPSSIGDAAERASLKSTDSGADPRESSEATAGEKKARGMFGGLMGGNTGGKVVKAAPGGSGGGGGAPKNAAPAAAARSETPVKEEKVRLSVGLSVQIRGKVVLAKASVYGMSV